MQEVLDVLHLGDLARLRLELLDLLRCLRLAAQPHDALGRVHADLALVDALLAEEDALDLAGDRHVVERLRARLTALAAGELGGGPLALARLLLALELLVRLRRLLLLAAAEPLLEFL